MNANPQTLDEAWEELENEIEEVEPLSELDFRRQVMDWTVLGDMGVDYE
jgi:hypothetical protein